MFRVVKLPAPVSGIMRQSVGVNRLTLARTPRQIEPTMGSNKSVRTFLDFVVDGQPLYEAMVSSGFDNISPIWLDAPVPAETDKALLRLLGEEPPDAPGARLSLYVCAECGDLGCGAVTVDLKITEDSVTWSDWGYQTNYDEEVHRDEVPALGALVFDRAEYETVLQEARRQLGDGEG